MANRLVVVSGASSGIGEAIARRLASDGDRVVCLARREDRLRALAHEIGASSHVVDLSDADGTAEVCRRILSDDGVPDVIVNNAGAGRFLSVEETTSDEAHEQMALPYFAAFSLTRGLIEPMIERGSGVVFQINTPAALVPWPGAVGYAAARYALRGFTDALRQDLWETGIKVGSFTPPRVHSDYFDSNPGAGDRIPAAEKLVGSMTPDQVADGVADALVKRPGKDTFNPWRLAVVARFARVFPAPIAWLYRTTGYRR